MGIFCRWAISAVVLLPGAGLEVERLAALVEERCGTLWGQSRLTSLARLHRAKRRSMPS